MPIKDKKAIELYRKQLLRRADAIQRHLDEVTRAAREELASIKDEIYALDSSSGILKEERGSPANILDHRPAVVQKDVNVRTMLIVEKQPHYARSLARLAESAGFKPVVASTAEGGLKKTKENHPDLILLGIELPDMDGLGFVSEIRGDPEADRIPIIAMSAFPHLKPRCLDLGCDDFLLKPARMIDLLGRTKKFLHSGPKASGR